MIYEGDTDACGLQTSPVEDIFVELFKTLGQEDPEMEAMDNRWGATMVYTIEWNDGAVRFVSIRGSGHLSPLNRPHVTQKMMAYFISDKSLLPFLPSADIDL